MSTSFEEARLRRRWARHNIAYVVDGAVPEDLPNGVSISSVSPGAHAASHSPGGSDPISFYAIGGQALGADKKLGATDARKLTIITNNVDRVHIGSSGDVSRDYKGSATIPCLNVGLGTHADSSVYCYGYSIIDTFQTTDATPINRTILTPPTSSAVLVELYVACIDSVNVNKAYAAVRRALFRRGTGVTTTLVGAVAAEYSEVTDLACATTLNASLSAIRANVTGIAATTLNWTLFAKITRAK